ncbi:MAG: hypothetical protein H6981_08530 [Gammaproteobacteria bacterium]|nr:hypothetical protein [Gammaproteobacteria bacterium]MCP5136833.1 hypothetical protein [Gammaproteobacteria bacterium]
MVKVFDMANGEWLSVPMHAGADAMTDTAPCWSAPGRERVYPEDAGQRAPEVSELALQLIEVR